jgi:hypothetical protein
MFHMGKIAGYKTFKYSAPFRPKFCRRFLRPLTFLLGPFWVMRPKNQPAGNTAFLIYKLQYLLTICEEEYSLCCGILNNLTLSREALLRPPPPFQEAIPRSDWT